MPYKSEAQRRYFNANREKLEAEGVDVDEWNKSSKGKKMPEKKSAIQELAEKAAGKRGLWDNIHAKRKRGEKPAKPGDKDYPDAKSWKKTTKEADTVKQSSPMDWGRDPGQTFEALKLYIQQNPAVKKALIGGGIGSAIGGLTSLVDDQEDLPESERSTPAQRVLDGILGGGVIGGGIGGGMGAMQAGRLTRDPNLPNVKEVEKLKGIFGKSSSDNAAIKALVLEKIAKGRCWDGYEPVPGKDAYSDDSCRKIGSKKKKKSEKKATTVKKSSPMKWGPGPGEAFEALKLYIRQNPAVKNALIGGGIGSAIGGLGALVDDQEDLPESERLTTAESVLSGILGGGVIGGGIGGGMGAMQAGRLTRDPNLPNVKEVEKLKGFFDKYSSDNSALKALVLEKIAKSPAWQREEGKSESGGLNAKGRASLKAQGQDIKAPVTQKNPKGKAKGRKASFCARMGGMKKKLTSEKTRNDPDSRINKALRKWNC